MFSHLSYYCIYVCFLAGLLGCNKPRGASADPAQNRYYNNYSQIYNSLQTASYDSTQHKLNQYLSEFPENADAWMLAGNLAYAQPNYPLADTCYRRAIALQPGTAVFYSALGALFNTQQLPDSAEKYLLKAISLNDSSAYTYLNASLLYLKKQNKPKSLAFADSALAKQPSSPVICSGLSFVFYQWEEPAKGQKLFDEAVNLGLKDTLAFKDVLNGKAALQDYYQKNYLR